MSHRAWRQLVNEGVLTNAHTHSKKTKKQNNLPLEDKETSLDRFQCTSTLQGIRLI